MGELELELPLEVIITRHSDALTEETSALGKKKTRFGSKF
jgi:hypothetical protein